MGQGEKTSAVVRCLSQGANAVLHPVRTLGELLQTPAQRVLRILEVTMANWFKDEDKADSQSVQLLPASGLSRSSVMFRNAAVALRDTPRLVSSRVWSRQRSSRATLQLR